MASGEKAGAIIKALLKKDSRCHRSEWKTTSTLTGKHQETCVRGETCMCISCTKELNHTGIRELPGGPTKDSQRPEKSI
jgi:hypothetical protein